MKKTFVRLLTLVLTLVMVSSTVFAVNVFASPLEASFVEFTADDTTLTARVRLINDSAASADGKIIIAGYDVNNVLLTSNISTDVSVAAGSEAYASVTLPLDSNANYYKAFVWSADGENTPLAVAARSDAAPELKGITVNGTELSGFNTETTAYNYTLSYIDGVLPVVKGIPADNSIYATTAYSIADDAQTATAVITVKNIFTDADEKTYTVNISLEDAIFSADDYNIVNMGSASLVDNTNVVDSYTYLNTVFDENSVSEVTHLVDGMKPSEYEAYVNEYLASQGLEAVDVADPELSDGATAFTTITTAVTTGDLRTWQPMDFGVGMQLFTTNAQRKIEAIHPDYSFLEDAVYLAPNANMNDSDNGFGWPFGAFNAMSGTYAKASATAHTYDYTGAPSVPWFEFTVNDPCTVYVANFYAIGAYDADSAWTKTTISEKDGVTGIIEFNRDSNMDGTLEQTGQAGPAIVYSREFNAGDKVQLFNPAAGRHTSFSFLTFIVPRDVGATTYGKKSNAVVATAFDSNYTNGVLYKNFRGKADLTAAETSGAQWVTDYAASVAGNNQRHEIYVVDSSLEGCEYFAFVNGTRNYSEAEGNLLEFMVDKAAKVSILTTSNDSSAAFDGYTKSSGTYAKGLFIQANFLGAIAATGVYAKTEITEQMAMDFSKSSNLTWNELYTKYFEGKTEKTSEELMTAINDYVHKTGEASYSLFESAEAVSSKSTYDTYTYSYAHSKTYKAGETVVIPKDTGKTSAHSRAILVVVQPHAETAISDHVSGFSFAMEGVQAKDYVAKVGGKITDASGNDASATDTTTVPAGSWAMGQAYKLTPNDGVIDGYDTEPQRYYSSVDEVTGLENAPYLRQTVHFTLAAATSSKNNGFAEAAFYGVSKTVGDITYDFSGDDVANAVWGSFVVNKDCDVIIAFRDSVTPTFLQDETKGWTNVTGTEPVVTLARKNGTSQGSVNNNYYIQSFKAGDTVELYNPNNGVAVNTNGTPSYHVFVRVK